MHEKELHQLHSPRDPTLRTMEWWIIAPRPNSVEKETVSFPLPSLSLSLLTCCFPTAPPNQTIHFSHSLADFHRN